MNAGTELLDSAVLTDEVATLVAAANAGDQAAWAQIINSYARLVWSIARSFRLGDADAADVAQATWLRLVQHLGKVRDPRCLGAWLATTARREALALLRRSGRDVPVDTGELRHVEGRQPAPDDRLLRAEQNSEVHAAFDALPARCRQLLRALLNDPPMSYEQAATLLDMPIGSVGPTRSRCLEQLRTLLSIRSAVQA
jgi:RNA polymerase sigma factor (sigma-70 family)